MTNKDDVSGSPSAHHPQLPGDAPGQQPPAAVRLEQLAGALALRERAIEYSANAMVITRAGSPDYVIEYVNPAFERITGFSAAEAVGQNCRFLQGAERDQPELDEIRTALREQRPGNAVLRNFRKDGTLFWNHLFVAPVRDESGRVTHFVASQYDITATKELEAKLKYLANHDDLTGLPNRTLLRDRLHMAVAQAARTGESVWLAFVSLDRFKVINDSLGHLAGDRFLSQIASRLDAVMRSSDTVARWSGDEFVVLMPALRRGSMGGAALERLMATVSEAVQLDGQEFVTTCSVGIACYPDDGDDADTLLQRADVATRHAKNHGANQFRFHTPDMNLRALERLHMEADLRLAIKRQEFFLHYQPQIDLASGRIVGAEALVRWQCPQRGMVSPIEFISIAEESGLIDQLGDWVLRTACRQSVSWQRAGLPGVRMAVNLSARQFARTDLATYVASVARDEGMLTSNLELELTESVAMRNVELGINTLRELKHAGVRVAIDDFGTGYSSLSYLKRFPIDILKIDRSFVDDIGEGNGDDAAIVTSIIALAHSLNLGVIAEGVETAQQLHYPQRKGCDEVQGYYFSKPVDADRFATLLGERLVMMPPAGPTP